MTIEWGYMLTKAAFASSAVLVGVALYNVTLGPSHREKLLREREKANEIRETNNDRVHSR